MRYNITCTSCGKSQHHKQLKINEVFKLPTLSALVGNAKRIRLSLCTECTCFKFRNMLDHLDGDTWKHFLIRNGEEVNDINNTKKNNS